MDRFAIVLLASAIGAGAGVFVVKALDDGAAPPAQVPSDLPEGVLARLERIEAKLDERPEPLTLRGSAPPPGAFTLDSPEGKRLLEAIGRQVKTSAKEAIEERDANLAAGSAGGPMSTRPPRWNRSNRKRMKLDEIARELELSSAEEQALSDVYDKSKEKLFELLAGQDGDVEAVRRDYERSRENPENAIALMGKYLPSITKNMGSFIQLRTDQQTGIEEAIGKDKAAKLEREYIVEERDILNPSALMRGTRRR